MYSDQLFKSSFPLFFEVIRGKGAYIYRTAILFLYIPSQEFTIAQVCALISFSRVDFPVSETSRGDGAQGTVILN